MLETISTVVVTLVSIYLLAGLLFSIPFLLRGAARLDPSAHHGSGGFRAMILPGTVALWPVLARKWRIAAREGK